MIKKENYGTEVTLEELKGHYKVNFLTPNQFIDLVKSWHESKVKKLTIVEQNKHLCQCEDKATKHFIKNWCDDCQKCIVS